MDGISGKHPKTAYAVLQKSLHHKCTIVQRVTPEIGTTFQTEEDELHNIFLPSLFNGDKPNIPRRAVTCIPVKQTGIALPKPSHTAEANWTASCVVTGYLVAAIHGTDEFWSGYHALLMGVIRYEIRRRYAEATYTELGEAQAATSTEETHKMLRIMWTGVWL